MSCILDRGFELGCSNVGGIETVWIGTYDKSTEWTIGTNSMVTGVTGANTVYLMEQDIEAAGMDEPGQHSRENLTVFYESSLSLKFNTLDNDLRNLMKALGKAPLYAIVKSNEGHYYLFGLESAGRANESAKNLGVAMGDMNGSTITITWKSKDGVYLIDGSLIGTDIPVG